MIDPDFAKRQWDRLTREQGSRGALKRGGAVLAKEFS